MGQNEPVIPVTDWPLMVPLEVKFPPVPVMLAVVLPVLKDNKTVWRAGIFCYLDLMGIITVIAASLIAALHLYILVLEAFFWDKPRGMKAFGLTPEFAASTKVMAANQGLYNGFLAAGLITALILGSTAFLWFFLACIFVAGIVGALTSSRKILFIQTIPSLIAAVFLLLRL